MKYSILFLTLILFFGCAPEENIKPPGVPAEISSDTPDIPVTPITTLDLQPFGAGPGIGEIMGTIDHYISTHFRIVPSSLRFTPCTAEVICGNGKPGSKYFMVQYQLSDDPRLYQCVHARVTMIPSLGGVYIKSVKPFAETAAETCLHTSRDRLSPERR